MAARSVAIILTVVMECDCVGGGWGGPHTKKQRVPNTITFHDYHFNEVYKKPTAPPSNTLIPVITIG
jgi:hypothetical protein